MHYGYKEKTFSRADRSYSADAGSQGGSKEETSKQGSKGEGSAEKDKDLGQGAESILADANKAKDPGEETKKAFDARASGLAGKLGIHDPTKPRARR